MRRAIVIGMDPGRLGESCVAVPCGLVGGVSFCVRLVSLCGGVWWAACLVVLGFAVSCRVASRRVALCHR